MIWIKNLIAARWFLSVLVIVPAVCAAIFGWGYLKGYGSASDKALGRIEKALAIQREEMAALKIKDVANVVRSELRKNEVYRRVDDIQRPGESIGDLPPGWLRAYVDGVRAANAGTGATDQAAPPPG